MNVEELSEAVWRMLSRNLWWNARLYIATSGTPIDEIL